MAMEAHLHNNMVLQASQGVQGVGGVGEALAMEVLEMLQVLVEAIVVEMRPRVCQACDSPQRSAHVLP